MGIFNVDEELIEFVMVSLNVLGRSIDRSDASDIQKAIMMIYIDHILVRLTYAIETSKDFEYMVADIAHGLALSGEVGEK